MRSTQSRGSQAGFTLIELVVVIVILGILAATAIQRFSDLSGDARIAKMRAAQAAIQTGSAVFHAQWLAQGSPANVAGAGTIAMEGANIPYFGGYPDVGGDGSTNGVPANHSTSGIVLAAGGLADYDFTTFNGTPSATELTISADVNHQACSITYTQSVNGNPPVIGTANLTAANCR